MSRFSVAFALTHAGVAATAATAPAEATSRTFRSRTGKLGCMFSSDAQPVADGKGTTFERTAGITVSTSKQRVF